MAPGVLVQPPAIAELRPDSGRYSRDRSPEEKLAQDRREKQDLAIFNPVSSKSLKTMVLSCSTHTNKQKDRRDTHT